MHKKLTMEQQIGRQLTVKDPQYQRLLEKAVDEQIEQEAERLEQQAAAAASKGKGPALQGATDDDNEPDGEQERRPTRNHKQPDRPGQIWLESWNSCVQPIDAPPTPDLFLEAIETMMVKPEHQVYDLIDRIGENFGIDTRLFLLQAEHWHSRANDDYTTYYCEGSNATTCWRRRSSVACIF
jgi:hypothetical protein